VVQRADDAGKLGMADNKFGGIGAKRFVEGNAVEGLGADTKFYWGETNTSVGRFPG
jgi:hypothetical protein